MIEVVSTGILAILMVLTVLNDLRSMRIPNWLSLAGIVGFCAFVSWTLPVDELLWRVGISIAALFIGIVLFALGAIGAGDVKILSVLLLFVPTKSLAAFLLIFATCMVFAIVAVVLARKWWQSDTSQWAFLRNEKRLPMGLAIGAAGLISIFG